MRFRTLILVASALLATSAFAQNARMGVRYQIVDSEVETVVTHFKFAEITSRRGVDGKVMTTVRSRSGNVLSEASSQPARIRLTATGARAGDPLTISDRSLDF